MTTDDRAIGFTNRGYVTGWVAETVRSDPHGAYPCVAETSKGVSYALDHVITTGGNCTAEGPCWYEEICPTMKAAGPHAVATTERAADYSTGIQQIPEASALSGKRVRRSDLHSSRSLSKQERVTIMNPWDSQGNQIADGRFVYPNLRGCGGAGYQQGYVLQIGETDVTETDDILCLNDQGGSVMHIHYGITEPLRAQMKHHEPIVLIYDARGNGGGGTSPTIAGDHQDRVTDYTAIVVEKHESDSNVYGEEVF